MMEQRECNHAEKPKNTRPFSDIPTLCKIGRAGLGIIVVGKNNKCQMWSDKVFASIIDALKSTKSPIKILVYGLSRAEMGHLINGIHLNTTKACAVVTWENHYILIINEKEKTND